MGARFVHANGLRFAYLSAGPTDGPLALCLHGFPELAVSWREQLAGLGDRHGVYGATADIIAALERQLEPGDHVLIMSNGGFEGIHGRLISALEART